MNDATGKALEVDFPRALDQVVLAITEVTGTSDVIDPHVVVRHWMSQLDATRRAHFLMIALSEGWERHLNAIARAVLAGNRAWSPDILPGPAVP